MTLQHAARQFGFGWIVACWFVLLAAESGAGSEPCAPTVAPRATPSNTRYYTGYYQGGGTVFRAEPRDLNEGTWGWDYAGIVRPKHIFLNWSHGRRYQGGTGAYRTAGPSPLHSQ